MIKRYIQRKQAKCNFCFEWFSCSLKSSIHLCQSCLDKSKTNCHIVPSPDGKETYQIFVLKNNVQVEQQETNEKQNGSNQCLIQNVDMYRNMEIKKLNQKWQEVTQFLRSIETLSDITKYTKLFDQAIKSYPTAAQILKNLAEARQKFETPHELYHPRASSPIFKTSIYGRYTSTDRRPLREMVNSPQKPAVSDFSEFEQKADRKSIMSPFSRESKSSRRDTNNKMKSRCKAVLTSPPKYNREKDLLTIAQNALKSRIYSYLETKTSLPQTLFLPQTFLIYEALQSTTQLNKCIQLVSFNIEEIDMGCYLSMLDWNNVDVLKLVKVGLSDEQFMTLIEFLAKKENVKGKGIETMVVTSNRLTQYVIEQLIKVGDWRNLKSIYMGRNRIKKIKIKDQIKQLEKRLTLFL